jgi:uncharacterized protein YggE
MIGKWKLMLTAIVLAIITVVGTKHSAAKLAQADAMAQKEATLRQITVIGEGTVSASPDIAWANLGVQVAAPTVTAATQQSNDTMNAVLAQLKAVGVAEKDIQTSDYSIYPQRNNSGPNSANEITGYQVTNMVLVTIRDLSQVGPILDQAVQAGANNVSNVSFGFSDPTRLRLQALDRAIADAQSRADELAKSSGVQRGEVLSMSEVISSGPGPRAGSMVAQVESLAVPIQPGSSEVQAQVQVVYAIQSSGP